MGTYLGLIYLIIFMAIFNYTITNFDYKFNVIFYVIVRGLVYSILFFVSWQYLIIHVVLRVIIGLIFVKIMSLGVDYFSGPIYTFGSGMIVEYSVTQIVLAILNKIII